MRAQCKRTCAAAADAPLVVAARGRLGRPTPSSESTARPWRSPAAPWCSHPPLASTLRASNVHGAITAASHGKYLIR